MAPGPGPRPSFGWDSIVQPNPDPVGGGGVGDGVLMYVEMGADEKNAISH